MAGPQNKTWLAQKVFSFDNAAIVSKEDELLFAITCFALSGESRAEIIYENPFPFDENLFNQTCIEIKQDAGKLFLTKNETGKEAKYEIDLSDSPQLAIPFALIIAAANAEADLSGLENLATDFETNIVPQFQRELYRFNILTDFCGHSKLKIYNSKHLLLKLKPVDVSQSSLLSLHFLTLTYKFSEIKIILPENFPDNYGQVFSGFVKLV